MQVTARGSSCRRGLWAALVFAAGAAQALAQCSDIPANPAEDADGAAFGQVVVLSADGLIGLASGPGFDLGDGLVRTFERVNGEWVEGPALLPHQFSGENFGWDMAMSDDGNTAIITAPRETILSPGFHFAGGAGYLYERDVNTGEWSNTLRWQSPEPGFEENFGASCDISADGNVIVIGETNVLGSEWQSAPDAAWVITRTAGTWGEPVQLVPTPAIGNSLNFGHAVAMSDDGTLIAVGAPLAPAFSTDSGLVCIFENQGGTWVEVGRLSRYVDGDSFNNFGAVLAFHGDSLLVVNPAEGGIFASIAPICVYHRNDGSYPTTPDELVQLTPDGLLLQSPSSLFVRGDVMLVGTGIDGSALHRFARDFEPDPDVWRFDAVFRSDDAPFPPGFGHGYGYSAAIADNPDVLIVGEPGWGNDVQYGVGRIHFPDRVFGNTDFDIPEATSSMFVDFDFPGMPLQQLFVQLLGFFNLQHPLNCNGGPIPIETILENFTITTAEPEHVLEGPLGVPITISQVEISLSGASSPAPVDGAGNVVLEGMLVHIEAMVQFGKLPAIPFSADGAQQEPMPATITGGTFGQPVMFNIPDLQLEFSPDIGLGENNPVISAHGAVYSQGPTPCEVDIISDGQLDFFDVQAFLSAFASQSEPGDWNDDFQYDFFDVQAFLNAYSGGCP